MSTIADNCLLVKDKVYRAAKKANVKPEDISVVYVSKRISAEKTQEAVEAGAKILGESRVQEAKAKIAELGKENKSWHMIGQLQKNKVNAALKIFDMIQSVDSTSLAEAIDKSAERMSIPQVNCLVQVNIGNEGQKGGFEAKEICSTLKSLEKYQRLKISGLMAIPPFSVDPEESRVYFKAMRQIWEEASKLSLSNASMDFLSMGMSNDYDVAIEEGANMVRVGTAIFGERDKIL